MFNFTLKQMRYVEAAGRLGSIAKAAEELSISQSSITAAIDSLERMLDYDIFVRMPAKGIQATPAGYETLQLIRGFIVQSRHFESEVQSIGGDITGLVRIACYSTAAPSFLPPILNAISHERPGISIKLLEGDMDRIMMHLKDGEADLAFTYQDATDSRHDFEPLFEAPPYVLIPAGDPLAVRESISLAELDSRPMVLLDLPLTREYFTRMFTDRGLRPNVVHSSRSSDFCRALVAGGFGFSILNIRPPGYFDAQMSYRALPISDDLSAPVFGIATIAGSRQPRTVGAFMEVCLKLRDAGGFREITVSESAR